MATSSSILSYIDNVVSSYDAGSTQARYVNLDISNDANLTNVLINGKASISVVNVGPDVYRLPPTGPSDGDYLAFDALTPLNSDGSKQLTFKNFNAASVSISTLGGLLLHPSRNDGTFVHVSNSTSLLSTDKSTEYQVIDNKPSVLPSSISLNDRFIISTTRPGSTVPDLNKMTLRNLLEFIEKENPGTSAIKYLTSNTGVQSNQYDVTFTIDEGALTKTSILANTGLIVHGDLFFVNDNDSDSSNAMMQVLPDGYKLSRYANSLSFDFEGTQNLSLKPNDIQVGTNLVLQNGAYVDMINNSFIELADNSHLQFGTDSEVNMSNDATISLTTNTSVSFVNLNTIYTFDQSLSSTDDIIHNSLALNDATNATAVGSAPFHVAGGGSIGLDLYVGGIANVFSVVTNSVNSLGAITGDSLSITTLINSTDINATANVDSAAINSGFVSAGNIDVAANITAGNDIFAANSVFSGTPPTVLSSIAYKENINQFENGLNYIMSMKPVTYDRKNSSSKNEIGFIAEEMETILPSIVKSGHGVKGIQYDQIVPILVSALQEQQQKINELENKIK